VSAQQLDVWNGFHNAPLTKDFVHKMLFLIEIYQTESKKAYDTMFLVIKDKAKNTFQDFYLRRHISPPCACGKMNS